MAAGSTPSCTITGFTARAATPVLDGRRPAPAVLDFGLDAVEAAAEARSPSRSAIATAARTSRARRRTRRGPWRAPAARRPAALLAAYGRKPPISTAPSVGCVNGCPRHEAVDLVGLEPAHDAQVVRGRAGWRWHHRRPHRRAGAAPRVRHRAPGPPARPSAPPGPPAATASTSGSGRRLAHPPSGRRERRHAELEVGPFEERAAGNPRSRPPCGCR